MARPTSKDELIVASARGYGKLAGFAASMTEGELAAPFDFSADKGKKEAHWSRDENLRDVLVHLHEWHRLLLEWVYIDAIRTHYGLCLFLVLLCADFYLLLD